jgi:DNA-binding NtrC family response regulator
MKHDLLLLNLDDRGLEQFRCALGDTLHMVRCSSAEQLRSLLDEAWHRPAGFVVEAEARRQLVGSVAERAERPRSAAPGGGPIAPDAANGTPGKLADRVDAVEKQIIQETLRRNRHSRQQTAAELGISRVTLYNKMRKFGLLR